MIQTIIYLQKMSHSLLIKQNDHHDPLNSIEMSDLVNIDDFLSI